MEGKLPVVSAELFVHPVTNELYRREGECCRCGDCCKTGDPFSVPPESRPSCRLYRETDGLGACSDRRHPLYLNGCNAWPTKPEHLRDYPRCTYRFVKA